MLEQELKLTAPNAEVLTEVLNSEIVQRYALGEPKKPTRFLANYYDTKDGDFEKHQCSLRARKEGIKFRAAFKQRGKMVDGLSTRHEYECDIDGWLKNAGMLPEGGLKALVLNLVDESEKLFPRVTVDMQRQIQKLDINGTKIELVTDHGVVKGLTQCFDLCEVELELISGDVNEINSIGEQLKAEYDLTPSVLTKHEIGLSLN